MNDPDYNQVYELEAASVNNCTTSFASERIRELGKEKVAESEAIVVNR